MAVKLKFMGAAQTVTGSCHLIETSKSRVLIDCGLVQERDYLSRNWENDTLNPETLDCVILTHAHLDHCGLLPRLVAHGFRGTIFCTSSTADIAQVVLEDSARIQLEDVKQKIKRHNKEGRKSKYTPQPLYTSDDVAQTVKRFQIEPEGKQFFTAPGVKASFQCNGHIIGATWVELVVEDQGTTRTIVFSGDIGRWGRPIIRDPKPPIKADYIVMESTYGDRLHTHGSPDEIASDLADIINETIKRGGNLIIPVFAIERAQEMLYFISQLKRQKKLPWLNVAIDSPMANEVTRIMQRHVNEYDDDMRQLIADGFNPFTFPGLLKTSDRRASKGLNTIRGTAIIMAGSGMCTGGRIKYHLIYNISRPESTILFVGYQANGTLGRIIIDGAESVRILGQDHQVRAKIMQLNGFSAHADQNELLHWVGGFSQAPKHCFVVHGGRGVSATFAQLLHEKKGWNASNPSYGEEVFL